jgi:hypothetical protein
VVKAWQAAEPGVVTYRDLAADAISHFSSPPWAPAPPLNCVTPRKSTKPN